jgi:CubicO group peptidase (beta-lactamase class C family)
MQHKHTVLLACACALAALVGATALRADPGPQPPDTTTTATTSTDAAPGPAPDLDLIERLILSHRQEAWRWERVMGVPLTRTLPHSPTDPGRRVAAWHRLALNLRRRAQNVPHKAAWLCIHRFEGSWTDPNPPYYGGLQMDLGFMRKYGAALLQRKGTADHWTPLEQMWTAERAHRSGRGFCPWPNTARVCGLI